MKELHGIIPVFFKNLIGELHGILQAFSQDSEENSMRILGLCKGFYKDFWVSVRSSNELDRRPKMILYGILHELYADCIANSLRIL